jgi:lipoprotein-anchoring transpeptidase ErfK/SrfK
MTKKHWLWRSQKFLAGAVLIVTALGVWEAPAFSNQLREIGESITKKAIELEASQERWIQIDLKNQRLIAWEGAKPVYAVVISTGKTSTPTRTGVFKIQTKLAKSRMSGNDYDIPDVPYVMFYEGNYAIHGAYWHSRFGSPVSHGCVNVAVDHARWLFDWASVGTPVVISE